MNQLLKTCIRMLPGLIACAVLWLTDRVLTINLRQPALVSGLILLILVLALALFNARKKLPGLPLLPARYWLHFHTHAGLVSSFLFFLHVSGRLPSGWLETTLAILFTAVSISGIAGLALSRWLPSRLTVYGENLIFERIPALRENVRRDVEDLVASSTQQSGSSTIADFYQDKLQRYFSRPRSLGSHIVGSRTPLHNLLGEVDALNRYLNADERSVMDQITDRIHAKDNLDYQRATQGLLKVWLFIHIPLTYALIAFSLAHGLLAWLLR